MDKLGHFGTLGMLSGQQEFSQKNLEWSVFRTYDPITSCKISKKLMSQSWQKCCRNGQIDKLGHFLHFWPIFGQARIFPKNLARSVMSTYGLSTSFKILKKNYEPFLRKMLWWKTCDVYLQTDRQTHIHRSLAKCRSKNEVKADQSKEIKITAVQTPKKVKRKICIKYLYFVWELFVRQ